MKWALITAAALLCACGGSAGSSSSDVGGQCKTDRDCEHRCVVNDTFGGGMCTITCASDTDCPNGSACISPHDGPYCAVTCNADTDCSSSFGRGWVCQGEPRPGGGNMNVCRLP